MKSSAATATTAKPTSKPAPLSAGDKVEYNDPEGTVRTATVARVHNPADPRPLLDLMVWHGNIPEALSKVAFGANKPGRWHRQGEGKPSPPTVAELVAASKASGNRVPQVGEIVLASRWALDGGRSVFAGRRARVLEVFGTGRVKLGLYRLPGPPEDTRDPDLFEREIPRASYGSAEGGWIYSDDPAPAPFNRMISRQRCTRCNATVPGERIDVQIGRDPDPIGRLCDRCRVSVVAFVQSAPKPAPEPAELSVA